MGRPVKHFSLHRIAGVELRAVADIEAGVLPVIQEEERVIRGYQQRGSWPHRIVTLFILQDLQPLVRQMDVSLAPASLWPVSNQAAQSVRFPQGVAGRPAVNVYDLADPSSCHVFVNRQAMREAGYWEDALAIRALLAHEHAHPLAENDTIRASRSFNLALAPSPSSQAQAVRQPKGIHQLLLQMLQKLVLDAPRELFANRVVLESGFAESLFHLNQQHVNGLESNRRALRDRLQQQVTQARLAASAGDTLLFMADLEACLELAIEVAPFYHAEYGKARQLEAVLEMNIFPQLDTAMPPVYIALRQHYQALPPDLEPRRLQGWMEQVLQTVTGPLARRGLPVSWRLTAPAAPTQSHAEQEEM